MGRIFEKRKARMFKRWAKMSKAFTKIGREIAIAVKEQGPDPVSNPRLRLAIQTAKSLNMPKEKIENAIKRSSTKAEGDFQEILYEGYAPHGIAVMIETATDNPVRTVANLRSYFNKSGGSLATDGAVSFLFERKGIFKIPTPNESEMEELSLLLIDAGADDIHEDENELLVYTSFPNYHIVYKFLESKQISIINSELQHIPLNFVELTDQNQQDEVLSLIDKIEEDDDVLAVFHNLK